MVAVLRVLLPIVLLEVCEGADVGVQVSGNVKHVQDGGIANAHVHPSPLAEPGVAHVSETAWQDQFAEGMRISKEVANAEDWPMTDWVIDSAGSGAVVPRQMLLAEELLLVSQKAPEPAKKEKTAELALRLYNHAKWLAERNYEKAAEWRYWQSHNFARQSRRSTLAAHSLSRLGYFLMHWRRHEEARSVLGQAEQLTTKNNPLAPYLLGVLERQVAGADVDRLKAAEDRILKAAQQPSDELEIERKELVAEISYWHESELSVKNCFRSHDAARLGICVWMHAFQRLKQLIFA